MTDLLPSPEDPDGDFLNDPTEEIDPGEFDSEVEPPLTLALFEGDCGGLSLPQRKALVVLMKNRFIAAAQRPNEWRILREDPEPIRARLNDMFLDLHIDYRYEVALKRQAVSDSGAREFPTLLYDTAYTREETILLVFLRHRFQSELNAGHDVVMVEQEELVAQVASFRPARATNRAGGEQAARNAVKNLVRGDVLIETNDVGRLRVSPVIAVLLPLPKLHELWEWLVNENLGMEEMLHPLTDDDSDSEVDELPRNRGAST